MPQDIHTRIYQGPLRARSAEPRIDVKTEHRDNLTAQCMDRLRSHGRSIRWSDFARETIRWTPYYAEHGLPENDRDLVRTALSIPDISAAWSGTADSFIAEAFRDAPVNSRGWVRHTKVSNFLPRDALTVNSAGRLERHTRGSTAGHMELGLEATSWGIARYTSQSVLGEETLASDQVGAAVTLFEQLGPAARNLSEDLIFSLVLSNPTLADSVALFHGDHGNLGTASLAGPSLYAGRAAIGEQVVTDGVGDPTTHLNLSGNALLVPSPLDGTARALVRAIQLGDGRDVEVRSDSRLSATGVIDPDTEEVRVGSATNWMLAANHESWPCVLIGGLDGKVTPKVRRFTLDQGQWGLEWDITLDVGAVVLAHHGLYSSDGTV